MICKLNIVHNKRNGQLHITLPKKQFHIFKVPKMAKFSDLELEYDD